MKKNLDMLDRIFRFALAFWWLGPWAPQFGSAWLLHWVVVFVGLIALLESFTGYCWLHKLFRIDNKKQ